MTNVIKQNMLAVWVQSAKFSAFDPLAVGADTAGLTGITIPLIDVAPTFVRDRFGQPLLLTINETPPGALPTATLTIFEKPSLNYFENLLAEKCPLALQRRVVLCGVLDDPAQWDKIMHMDEGLLTVYNPGDGPSQEFAGTTVTAAGTLVFRRILFLVRTSLSEQITEEVANFLSIAGIPDQVCQDCGDGYPGADQVLYAAAAADTGVAANLWWTNNGGGNWASIATPPFPVNVDIGNVVAQRNGVNGVTVIVGASTAVAATKPRIAEADAVWGDEGGLTFAVVPLASATDNVAVTALGWMFHNRLYIGLSDGDIHLSEDRGQTDPGAAIFAGSAQVNGFARDPRNNDVYAFGATNTLLREQGKSGSFSGRVGPTGGGIFHSLAIAEDGSMYAGNGTSLYRSNNLGANTGGWELVQNFGTSKRVVGIHLRGFQAGIGGSSQVIDLVVDDATPGNGRVYRSQDGGTTLTDVTLLTNGGYNASYASDVNNNKLWAVGDVSGGEGQIHLMTPNS